MAVHIRLRRIGKNPKKRPHFRISVSDQRRGRDSRVIEELGYYTPVSEALEVNLERIKHWTSKGALMSDTVKSLVKKMQKKSLAESNPKKSETQN